MIAPHIYTSADHHIRNDLIDPHALSVLRKLHEAGFTAYLVGGSVRDLLMRKKPKDFDISTSAKPQELKALFQRQCILIGRRFCLAHIRFGRMVVEVATFRSGDPTDERLIVQDNLWGTPAEDVLRRDFTINGLFYDPLDHKIIDYVGGFEDLHAHCLRTIGDPQLRFKQDPVRMIRMEKFRARFGFHVDPETLNGLHICHQEIHKSSPARVLEEILRMLESAAAAPFFRLLVEDQMLENLFPRLHHYFSLPCGPLILHHLEVADAMNSQGYALDRTLLLAALIYPILEYEIEQKFLTRHRTPHLGEVIDLTRTLLHEVLFSAFTHFPRRLRPRCEFILYTQYRLTPLDKKKRPSLRILHQGEFPYALTFLKLRALVHHQHFKTYEHWKRLHQTAPEKPKETLKENPKAH